MMEYSKPPKPRFETWGQRIAWLGRMPVHYRVLFGTQAVIFGLIMQYRMSEIKRIRLRLEAQQQKEEEAALNAAMTE
jgi:hypothetical protein